MNNLQISSVVINSEVAIVFQQFEACGFLCLTTDYFVNGESVATVWRDTSGYCKGVSMTHEDANGFNVAIDLVC